MNATEPEHDWFIRQIPAALADGLGDEERQRFDAHAGQCPDCGRAIDEAREVENGLNATLGDLRPDAGLEDRIVAGLPHRFVLGRPPLRRVAAIAAATAVAACGLGMLYVASRTETRTDSVATAMDYWVPPQVSQAMPLYGQSVPDRIHGEERSALSEQLNAPAAEKSLSYPVFATHAEGGAPPAGAVGFGGGGFGGGGPSNDVRSDLYARREMATDEELKSKLPNANSQFQDANAARASDGGAAGAAVPMTLSPADAAAPSEAPVPAAAPAAAEAAKSTPAQEIPDDRKIIRTGEMNFEVDNFDSAYKRLYSIVHENRGFISGTDSERLPNGKMHGDVTVRVPPENLDTLVLALRALGDLQSQQVNSQDVTKEYTDLAGALRAGKAMEDRLIDLIHTGRGQIKDLLAAENELGQWREKDETLQGQINYYNNQISLSTLTVTLTEKDIGQASEATETRTVSAGLEVEDVRKVHDEILNAVDAAKGHIIHAELSEQEAGEFTSTIVAAIPPDAAEGVIDQLARLGHVTRMQSHTEETVKGEPAPPDMKVERADTVLNLSIFNVAAYTARVTDNLSIACEDVESAYRALLDFVNKSDGGRVVSFSLTRPTPDTPTGSVVFEVRETSADAAAAYLRGLGTVLQLNVNENADGDNVTSSKRAFTVTLVPIDQIPPRETQDVTLLPAGGDLRAAFNALLDFASKPENGARIIDKDLEQQNGAFSAASITMEVSRATLSKADSAILAAGKIIDRKATRQADSANCIDSEVLLNFSFVNVDALEPSQTLTRTVAAGDVARSFHAILDAATGAGASVQTAQVDDSDAQHVSADLEFIVHADKQADVQAAIDKAAFTLGGTVQRAAATEASTDLNMRFRLHLVETDQLSPRRTYQLEVQAAQPIGASGQIANAALAAGGKVIEQSTNLHPDGTADAHLIVELPLSAAAALDDAACGTGTVHSNQSSEDTSAPGGPAARGRLEMQFVSAAPGFASSNGIFATVQNGLQASLGGLLWSVQWLVIGLCLAGPWAAIAWVGWWVWKRRRSPRDPGLRGTSDPASRG
ncbi:MAG TPA: DUF4349 domain-containing protein [Tepidisphaeraceae bacterium]|nr:DUF4349 domain-containing protein [Tepidisphaeraceae bacterium]